MSSRRTGIAKAVPSAFPYALVVVAYRDTVLADSPVHYWEFASFNTNVVQDLGSNPLPQLSFGGTDPHFGYSGVWDGGLSGEFSGGSVSMKDVIGSTFSAPLTAELWALVFPHTGNNQVMFSWNAGNAGFILEQDSTGKVEWLVDGLTVTAPSVLSTFVWHHIVGTYASGTARLYVDGAQVATAGSGGAIAGSSATFQIATSLLGASIYNGFLASVAAYGAALSSTQVSAHYAAADLKTIFPVMLTMPFGGYVVPSGTQLPLNQEDLTSILNAVRKTFPTT